MVVWDVMGREELLESFGLINLDDDSEIYKDQKGIRTRNQEL